MSAPKEGIDETLDLAVNPPPFTAKDVVELWNAICVPVGISSSRAITLDKNKRQLASLLAEHPGREWWTATFERIAASDFCRGL